MKYTTNNEDHGFSGTIAGSRLIQREIARLYDLTARLLVSAGHLKGGEVEEFLDSKQGRHFADQMQSAEDDHGIYEAFAQHAATHVAHWRQGEKP